jgi:UDP-3-O-[3-hydroxymyristoyl] glucosamine N-acyltransferase
MSVTLDELAKHLAGEVVGDGSVQIIALSSLDAIAPGTLVFADGDANLKIAQSSEAAAILAHTDITSSNKPLIRVPNPFRAFIKLLHYFYPEKKPQVGIHPSAVIADDVQLGRDVTIGPYVIIEAGAIIGNRCVLKGHIHIGEQVHIGDECCIYPQVTIYNDTHIGSRVIIHASTVIGSDGFGYTFAEGRHLKIPHKGRVVIEDDVEIGANTAVDRATLGETRIGQGTKIDNLVQVAHSVKLGKHNILCGFTGIAGSTTTGDHVIFAANVGVSDHVRIESNVILGARTGVPPHKHLKEGVYLGSPARPKDKAIKHELAVGKIPLIRKNIQHLSEELLQLKKQLDVQTTE